MRIHSLKALKDNYIFVLESDGTNEVIVIDPSEASPVIEFCTQTQRTVRTVINTHHHYDHVGGNEALAKAYDCEIACFHSDLQRTPAASKGLQDGESFVFGDWNLQVIHIPGHTQGQIALHDGHHKSVFVGDTLFRFGCGRLFEGDAAQMWKSLQKLKALPPETKVYCGHEYGLRNLEFVKLNDKAMKAETAQELQQKLTKELEAQGQAVPFTLEEQTRFNPFLKAESAEEFSQWRSLRDQF